MSEPIAYPEQPAGLPAAPPSPVVVGLGCRCPRCGKGRLFPSFAALVPVDRCEICKLSFDFAEKGDGPAVFAIFILGFLVLGGALIAEFKFGMPVWGHVMLWGVLTPLLALWLLRTLKATLIAMQYRYKAKEAVGADVARGRE